MVQLLHLQTCSADTALYTGPRNPFCNCNRAFSRLGSIPSRKHGKVGKTSVPKHGPENREAWGRLRSRRLHTVCPSGLVRWVRVFP